MSLKSELNKAMKKRESKSSQVMARLPEDLKQQVDIKMEQHNLKSDGTRLMSWQVLIEAACRDYLGIKN